MNFFKLLIILSFLSTPMFAAATDVLHSNNFQTPERKTTPKNYRISRYNSPSFLYHKFLKDADTYGFYEVLGNGSNCPLYDKASMLELALAHYDSTTALEIFQLDSDWTAEDLMKVIETAIIFEQAKFLKYIEDRFDSKSSPCTPETKSSNQLMIHLLYYALENSEALKPHEVICLFDNAIKHNNFRAITKLGKNYGTLFELSKINDNNFYAIITFTKSGTKFERTFLINREQAEALIQENTDIKISSAQ